MSLLRDIASAVRLLTVVGVPGTEGARPVQYFTWVGWLYATLGAGLVALVAWLGRTGALFSLLSAALVIASWGVLSGFLHWDGLADSADGIGVRGDSTHRLDVMRDSTIGAFGVGAIVFVALVQVVALAAAIDAHVWWALGAPVVGRCGAALALWHRKPARADGLGARYSGSGGAVGHAVLFVALLPLAFLPFPPSPARLIAVTGCLAAAALIPSIFTRRLGGVTGDVLGATILLSETLVLVVAALGGGSL